MPCARPVKLYMGTSRHHYRLIYYMEAYIFLMAGVLHTGAGPKAWGGLLVPGTDTKRPRTAVNFLRWSHACGCFERLHRGPANKHADDQVSKQSVRPVPTCFRNLYGWLH